MASATTHLRWLGNRGLEAAMLFSACGIARAQMPIGSVSVLDATVTGANSTANDRAELGTNGTVVAKDHVAYVQLYRGGSVKVCATSGVHLTAGAPIAASPSGAPSAELATTPARNSAAEEPATGQPAIPPATASTAPVVALPPLMVALDRGAMELRMASVPGDIVMTPDLRFSFSGDGQLDVHLRVTRNGDTCVENRVAGLSGHPELRVGSLFGNETYNVLPGQHVLFEGGNLREVVDNESSPCGCPEPAVKAPVAEVGSISLPKRQAKNSNPAAAAQNPFPADVSQGLAPPPPVPQAPPGVVHTQVATTLVYNPAAAGRDAKKSSGSRFPAPAQKSGFFHSVGRFFKRIF